MNAGGSFRRLWLVDHLLRDGVGHHSGYNAALAAAADRTGVAPVVVGHRDAARRSFPRFPTIPHFRTDWRSEPPGWIASDQRLLAALEALSTRRFMKDLRCLPPHLGEADLVFAQMIAPRHLLAWVRWLDERTVRPVLALHLGYQPWRFERPEVRAALQALGTDAAHLLLVTDSEKLVGPFEKALGAPVHHLPHVVETEFPPAAPSSGRRPTVFFAAGNARREKGFADLLEALILLAPRLSVGELVVRLQCHRPDSVSAGLLARTNVCAGVTLLEDGLREENYNEDIAGADVLLLPYHLDHYAMRTSGVFCEARCAGRPVIATRGSWAGDRVERQGGGWIIPEKNPQALAAAMAAACGPELTAKSAEARALQEHSRQEFSPDGFVASLLQIANRNP